MKFENKSVLITGANGSIGGSLLDFFMFLNQHHSANVTIQVIVRSNLKKLPFFNYDNVKIICQDITQPLHCEVVVDYIFHAASNAHPKAYKEQPVETILTNVLGTKNMLDLARITDATVVLVSSSEVYGRLVGNITERDENDYGYIDILAPRSCYSESKRMAETLLSSYIAEYSIKGMVVRPSYIYGARLSETNTRADVEFISKCISGKNIVMKSPGLQMRSYCYVLDCIHAMLIVAQNGKIGEAYNISSDTGNVTLVEFAQQLASAADVSVEFNFETIAGGNPVMNSLLSNEKLKSIGWQEIFTLESGIKDVLTILSTESTRLF